MQPEDGGPTDSNPVRTIRDEKNGSPKMEGMSEHSNTVRNTSPAHSHRSQASVHSHAGQSRHHPRRGHQHINTKHERDLLTKILTNQELQRPYSVYEADELVQNILRLQRASQRFDNAPSSQHEISGSESMRSIGGTSSPYDNATASQNASDIETGSPVESNRNTRKSHRFQYWRNPPAFQELTTRQKICSVIRCPANSALGFWYNLYIAFLVIASMILLVIQSCLLNDPTNVDYFTNYWSNPIFWINAFISINFLLEIIVEFIATSNRKEYIFSWFFLMQILSILPFLLELIALLANVDPAAIEALRVLAILRLIRLFRLIVIFQSINVDSSIFVRAVRSSTFALLFLGFFLTAGLLFFSALIFYVETAYCFLDPTGTWIYSDLQVSICNPGLIIHTCDAVTSGYPCVFQNIPDAM